jgi:Family of unknown function (DUF5677)
MNASLDLSKEYADSLIALEPMAKEDVEQIEKLLSGTNYCDINEQFSKIEKAKKGKFKSSKWYELEKINSFGQLCKKVGKKAHYDVLYNKFSSVMHSTSLDEHIKFGKDKIDLEPIRYLKDMNTIISISCTMAIGTYRTVLEHYRFSELPIFTNKYISEWKEPFMNMPKVKIKEKNAIQI